LAALRLGIEILSRPLTIHLAVPVNMGTVGYAAGKSGGGPPQSKTLVRDTMIPEIREAFWSAPALWRFARKTKCPRDFRMNFCAPMTI
jgi:hypothetical protein